MSIKSLTNGGSDLPLMSKQRGPAYMMGKKEKKMPLHKGAKPGSEEFGENIAAEIDAGKAPKQAQAITYSESRQGKKKHSSSHGSHQRHKEHR